MAQVQQSSHSPMPSPLHSLYWVCRLGPKQPVAGVHTDGRSTDALMVVVSAIMVLLAGLLLVRGLVRRLSGSATTHPTVRFFLWVVFAIFLPLTTYMFSVTKNSGEELRPLLILLWMLLAELLRKKLDGVSTINASPLPGVNKQSGWDAVNQIARIAWIGCLIYWYAPNGILVIFWALGIMKIAHRVAAVEVAKCSFALGENSHLVAGYMRQLFPAAAATGGEDQNVMTECKYVIMGEKNVERNVGPQGYSLVLTDQERQKMVTVGNVWQLAESRDTVFGRPFAAEAQGCLSSFALYQRLRSRFKKYPLKDLCLSFALYKLLRRRFEDYPSAEAGSPKALDFLLRGLLSDDSGDENKGERVFRVIGDELNFLRDYYFSTIPLMLSNIWLFLLNCVLTLVIPFFCCIVILYFSYLYIVSGFFCSDFIDQDTKTVKANIVYDLIVTLLVIATLFLLEFAEALFFVLSDWVVVYLLCNYVKNESWRKYAIVRWVLTTLGMVKNRFKHPKLKLSQHSILKPHYRTQRIFSKLELPPMLLKHVPCRCFHGLRWTPVPKEVKIAIVNYLVDNGGRGPVPPIGESVLRRNGTLGERLLWACKRNGVAETIIVWHIATCHYENEAPWHDDTLANRSIATTLSKYCAYLVALAPELLPDDTAGTKAAYKAAVKEIKKEDGKRVTRNRNENGTAAERITKLGGLLVAEAAAAGAAEAADKAAAAAAAAGAAAAAVAARAAAAAARAAAAAAGAQLGHRPEENQTAAKRGMELGHLLVAVTAAASEAAKAPATAAEAAKAAAAAAKAAVAAMAAAEEGGAQLGHQPEEVAAAEGGAQLGQQPEVVAGDDRWVWKVLAELWTEIMVYVAPSDDVKSHAQALAYGGEFITHIWALLSHGGILRWTDAPPPPPPPPPPPADHDQSPV